MISFRMIKFLLVFLGAIPVARADDDADVPQCDRNTTDTHHRYDPLACWLWNLQVGIPDQSFREAFVTVQIKAMKCTNFSVSSVDSSYVPSSPSSNSNNKNPAINVAASGISATCIGSYHATGGIGGSVQAWVQQSDGPPHSMALMLEFYSTHYNKNIRMASSVNATNCQAFLQVSSLQFGGSISARLINLFKSSIQHYVSDALSSTLCPTLEPELSNDLTKVIQQANKIIIPLLPKNSNNGTVAFHDAKGLSVAQTLKRPPQRVARRRLARNNTNASGSIDWRADTPVLYKGLDMMNRLLDTYLHKGFFVDAMSRLGWNVDDSVDCGYFFRGINGLVRTLTHGQVSFQVPAQIQNVTFVIPGYGRVDVSVHHTQLVGLDNFSTAEVFQPRVFPKQSFSSSLKTESDFNVSIAMNVQVSSIEGGIFQGDPLQEAFSISVNATRASVGASVAIDVDKNILNNVHLQDIIWAIQNYNNVSQWSCLLAPVQFVDIADTNLNVALASVEFSPTGSTGALEKDIDKMLNSLIKLFLTEYDLLVTEALAGLVQGPARDALNNLVASLIDEQQSFPQNCQEIPSNDAPDFVDFSNFVILDQLNQFLNRSIATINQYISCVANVFDQSVRPVSFQIENIHVNVTELSLLNPGCIKQLEGLKPTDSKFELTNTIDFRQCSNKSTSPELFSTINVTSPLFQFDGLFNVSAWLGNATLSGGSFLMYDLVEFRRLSLSTLLSDSLCATMPIADFRLLPPAETFERLSMNLTSVVQTSAFGPTFVSLTTENHESIPDAAQSILSWGLASIEEVFNGLVKGALAGEGARKGTEPPENYDGNDAELEQLFVPLAVAATVFVVLNMFILCVRLCKRRAPNSGDELAAPLLRDDPYLEIEPDDHSRSDAPQIEHSGTILCLERAVPAYIRHFFPVVVIGTIFLLLASNLSVGASVDLVASSDSGKTLSLPSLFAFSLGNTARSMYSAGIYSLLFLVAGFSGVWPYAKLLLMLFGWCAPTKYLSAKQRGRMLFLLDALGKFSLVDTYVLVLMMVSFRFHLVLDGLMTLDVYVNPDFGFYSFLLATSSSLLAGHVILHFHRRSLHAGRLSDDDTKEALYQHKFDDSAYGTQRRMTKLFSVAIAVVMVLAVVFLSIGMTKQSFIFEVGGLAGKLLDDEDRTKRFSLLSLGTSLRKSVQSPSLSMTCLQVAYFFYSVIMPFSCLVALAILFLIPMKLPSQKRIMTIAEISNAWSAVEVFALSIVVSLFELPTFASFMIDYKCNLINEFLANHFDDQLDGNDTCYTVSSSVASDVWFLICGAILNSIIVSFLLKVAHRAISERIQRQVDEEKDILEQDASRHDLVSMLLHVKLGGLLFMAPDVSAEELAHRRQGSKEFWEEWREVCAVT